MSRWATFAICLAIGVFLALVGLALGFFAMAAALVAAVVALLNYGRVPFAGIATGIGATWTVVFGLAARSCAQPDQPCGAAPIDSTPLIISVIVLGLGVVATVLSLRRPKGATTEG